MPAKAWRSTITVSGAAGGAGVATANAASPEKIRGIVKAVYLEYTLTPPAGTTDVTIATVTAPAIPILTITNGATDGWRFPMWQADDAADGSDITNQGVPIQIDDNVIVTIAQANDDDGVIATIVYEQL